MTFWQWILLILVILAAGALVMAIFSPRRFVRMPFRILLELLYRKRIVGLENFPQHGGCVVVSNHVSWIDGILLLWMLPRNVRFVVDGANFQTKLGKYLGDAFETIYMMTGPKSIMRAIMDARDGLNRGDVIGLFPEGTLTRTGQLQGFKPGLRKFVQKTDAVIVPVWMDGMWGSIFSFSGGKFFFKRPNKLRRRITLYIGQPVPRTMPLEHVRGRVHALGAKANVDRRADLPVLTEKIIHAWRRRGGQLQVADSLGNEVSGREMLIRTLVLRRLLRREVLGDDESHVAVLLPPSVAAVAVNVALAMDRRVSVNLNYTAGSDVLNHCTRQVNAKHVLTSERFLSKLDLQLETKVVLLESLRQKVTAVDKVTAAMQAILLPTFLLKRVLGIHQAQPDDLLTVIFTSGSTGMPKGVQLTMANISHNVQAVEQAVKLDRDDTVLGVLPFFHSFGYSVTLWSAQSLGPRVIYHFNPLDAKQIGKLSQKYGVTVVLATPTFLRGYIRRITPEQFAKLDVAVVGAEKMPADLFDAFEEKFGVRPVEGYGTTELSPLVSVNIPPSRSAAKYQPDRVEGSVGRPLQGVCAKIVQADTGDELPVDQDGMLLVTGPNVMKGYIGQDDLTAQAIQDGWYTTGDIANIDAMGFIHITGRLSRFSKIGGEMVPHVRLEEELARLLIHGDQEDGDQEDGIRVCVTSVPCPKKGERLVVLHLATPKTPQELRQGLQAAGLSNLYLPGADSFFQVDEIPMLGTGKLDLKKAKDIAAQRTGAQTGKATD